MIDPRPIAALAILLRLGGPEVFIRAAEMIIAQVLADALDVQDPVVIVVEV